MKNRSTRPLFHGYRDFLLNLRVWLEDGTMHVCELQVHFRDVHALGTLHKTHSLYEYFRAYFGGDTDVVARRLDVLLPFAREQHATCEALVDSVLRGGGKKGPEGRGVVQSATPENDEGDAAGGGALVSDPLLTAANNALAPHSNRRERGGGRRLSAPELGSIAALMSDLGRPELELELRGQELELTRAASGGGGGEDTAEVAEALHNCAGALDDRGKFEEAAAMYLEALRVIKKVYGKEHSAVADVLNNLAVVYDQQGKLEQSAQAYKKALVIMRKVYSGDHERVAVTLNNLAGIVYKQFGLDEQGEAEESTALYEEALRIRKKVHGSEHADVADTLNNIGVIRTNQGRLAEALALYEEALRVMKRAHGPVHASVADCLNNMAVVFDMQASVFQTL